MMPALCKLCVAKPPIENSHVLPRMAYKLFVTNLKRGGSFVDLAEMREHNRQLTRDWFCEDCETLFAETYAAAVLRELKEKRHGFRYTGELLRFATSLSYRACLYDLHEGKSGNANKQILRRVCKVWADYLLGKSETVRPYTQHGYVIDDDTSPWDERMGCQVAYINDLVITQMGPLVCFGLLADRSKAGRQERWALRQSELRETGGVLRVISQRVKNYTLTDDMTELLNHANKWCLTKAKEFQFDRPV